MKPDTKAEDRGEPISLMEPLLIGDGSRRRAALTDLALELTQKSAGFRRSLPASLLASLADFVRAMNCYYSNLIEGHDTHPVDIERALKNDYSKDARTRDLQFEAKAHIAVQECVRFKPEDILTPEEVAARLKVPESWVYEKTRARCRNPMPCLRLGRYIRFDWNAVIIWLSAEADQQEGAARPSLQKKR